MDVTALRRGLQRERRSDAHAEDTDLLRARERAELVDRVTDACDPRLHTSGIRVDPSRVSGAVVIEAEDGIAGRGETLCENAKRGVRADAFVAERRAHEDGATATR